MELTFALYLLLVTGLLLFLVLVNPLTTPVVAPKGYNWERRFGWLLLAVYLGTSILRLQSRAMDALATQGLSTQNKVQVVIVAMAALWCGYLFLGRRITLRWLVSGPGYWLLCLVAVYALSMLWSTWPKLTMFRVAELAVFWVIVCHLFSTGNWFRQFEFLMWFAWFLYLVWGVLLLAGFVEGVTSDGHIVGIVTSNSASLLAGLLFLWTLHRSLAETSLLQAAKLPVLALSLIMFGSLATTVFVLLCSTIMLTMHTRGHLRVLIVLSGIALVAVTANVILMQTGEPGAVLVDTTSAVSGKSRGNILGMTGRLELWSSIWMSARDQPWGFGFAAFERMFAVSGSSLSWKAGNAHNGFISAWLGAGWLAVALLLSYLASVWLRRRNIDAGQQSMFSMLLLLILLNNLTMPAVGGRLTVAFLVLMALAQIPMGHGPTTHDSLDHVGTRPG